MGQSQSTEIQIGSTDLLRLILNKKWEEATKRAKSHPEEVNTWYQEKSLSNHNYNYNHEGGVTMVRLLPLHLACEGNAPMYLIRTLVHIFADAVKLRDHRNLWLPLHYCATAADNDNKCDDNAERLNYILGEYPAAVDMAEVLGRVPLHLACEYGACADAIMSLVSANPDSVKRKNKEGQLPLHLAAMNRCDVASIQTLLRSYPASVQMRDYHGTTPIQYMKQCAHPNQWNILSVMERERGALSSSIIIDGASATISNTATRSVASISQSQSQSKYYTHISASNSTYKNDTPHQTPKYTSSTEHSTLHLLLLHAKYNEAVEHISSHPEDCTRYHTLQTSDDRVWSRTLPLHVLCRHRVPNYVLLKRMLQVCNSSNIVEEPSTSLALHLVCEYGIGYVDVNVVRLLLKVYRSALFKVDGLGMLPLHCAIWGCPNDNSITMLDQHITTPQRHGDKKETASIKENVHTILGLLLRYNPGAIQARDKYGRTPIQLAQKRNCSCALKYLTSHLDGSNNSLNISQTLSNASSIWTRSVMSYATNQSGWNSIQSTTSHNALLHAIQRRNWAIIPDILRTQPGLAQILKLVKDFGEVEPYGTGGGVRLNHQCLPLHLALRYTDVPVKVIQALLIAYPEAVALTRSGNSSKGINTIDDGALPLHIALTHKCSVDVMEALLRAYPQALKVRDVRGRLPQDYFYAASNASVGTYGTSNKEEDDDNRTRYIAEALRRDMEYWKSGNPQSPINHPKNTISSGIVNGTNSSLNFNTDSALRSGQIDNKNTVPMKKTEDKEKKQNMLRKYLEARHWEGILKQCSDQHEVQEWYPSKHKNGTLTNMTLPLHELCKLHPPIHVVQAMLTAYPAAIHMKDSHSMLPLHCACEAGSTAEVIRYLVHWYPNAMEEVDGYGRVPVTIVLEGDAEDKIGLLEAVQPSGDYDDDEDEDDEEYSE